MNKPDMKTAGSGTITAGEYDKIRTAGACRVEGDIICDSLHVAGSCHADNSIKCMGKIKTAGTCYIDGHVEAARITISGSCNIGDDLIADQMSTVGSCHIGGNLNSRTEVKCAGSLYVEKSIHAEKLRTSGSLVVEGDCEAEEINIVNPNIKGMLNGGSIEIQLNDGECFVDSIGCGSIFVDVGDFDSGRHFFFKKHVGGMLTTNMIEADEVKLMNVCAKRVTCKNAIIASNCEIGIIEYRESVEILDEAKIGELRKI